ncbi:ATP-binding protein [Aneurinibacillus tyrosinisolvens]|uniref:ATP-binding protein n=1 Tax=Aneurinibacillus tyrosinisolvens TaxID=1443435 RepID=UPI00063EF6BE|nr:ATP-binding protein [Aneurinibacillus tyrosinisolvens]
MPNHSFQLEISVEQMENHLHSVPFAAVFFDGDGNIVEANAVLLQATGHTYEQIKQKTFQDLFLTRGSFTSWIQHCKDTLAETKQNPRAVLKLKTGGTCTCDLVIYSYSGTRPAHYILLPKISELHNHSLFAYPYYQRQVMEDVNLGLVVLNHEARIIEISAVACEILGVKKEYVINQTIEDAFPGVGEGQHFISPAVLQGVTVCDQAFSWSNGDQRFELIVDSHVFRDTKGEIRGGYFVFKNVSNMRSLEQKIERSDRLAMIGQIAAGTAHEIRNPLTSINGFLQMMKKSLGEAGMEKEKEYTEIMLLEIKRINGLLSEFLLLSKQKEIQYKPVDIEQVCVEILPIVKNEALLQGIDVVVENEGNLPLVLGDTELLKQVLLNVTKNGIEAMGGEGTLTIRLFKANSDVEITIHDTGPGIPPYLADKIFEPFFTTKENGTGLGLPVCQKIIHEMRGSIRVSTKGYGTTFHIYLPAC